MYLTWRERLEREPDLRDFANWPTKDSSHLSDSDCAVFDRNRRMVVMVLAGHSVKKVADANNVSENTVTRLMKRALAGDENGTPPLTDALIPNTHIEQDSSRTADPEYFFTRMPTCRGAFEALFDHVPRLRENLDKMILGDIRDAKHGQNTRSGYYYDQFIRILKQEGWPQHYYPLRKRGEAKELVRRDYAHRRAELTMPSAIEPTKARKIIYPFYLEDIHIDSQLLDENSKIVLDLGEGILPIRVPRMSLLVAVCSGTSCNLAHHLVMGNAICREDILILLHKIRHPWVPMQFMTPGFRYRNGAGYPSAIGGIANRIAFGTIRLDNALAHHANVVREMICAEDSGTTLHFGLPGKPKTRDSIEHAFDLVTRMLVRFKSTTGRSPKDPLKESKDNRKEPPLVWTHQLEEAIEMHLANQNAKHLPHLGGSSPLETIRYQIANYLLPMLPNEE